MYCSPVTREWWLSRSHEQRNDDDDDITSAAAAALAAPSATCSVCFSTCSCICPEPVLRNFSHSTFSYKMAPKRRLRTAASCPPCRRSHGSQPDARNRVLFFERFPYVCPEPGLAKGSFISQKVDTTTRFLCLPQLDRRHQPSGAQIASGTVRVLILGRRSRGTWRREEHVRLQQTCFPSTFPVFVLSLLGERGFCMKPGSEKAFFTPGPRTD
jgi:hypothetical protein